MNPKPEIRRPKSEGKPKPESPKRNARQVRISAFGLPSAFGFRISFWLVLGVWCLELFSLTGCVTRSNAKAQAQAAYVAGEQRALSMSQQPRGPTVTMVGPVRNSVVPWVEGLTLANAIIAADYFGKNDPTAIVVTRQGRLIPVDPKQLLSGHDVALEAGDIVELRP
jgi:hypothetical protein